MIRLFILKNNFEKKKIDDSNTSSILSKNCNCMPPLLHNVSLQFSYFMINAISPSYLFVARQNFLAESYCYCTFNSFYHAHSNTPQMQVLLYDSNTGGANRFIINYYTFSLYIDYRFFYTYSSIFSSINIETLFELIFKM